LRALAAVGLACLLLSGGTGCAVGGWFTNWKAKRPDPPPGAVDSMTLGGGDPAADAAPKPGSPAADLQAAHRLYQQGEYAKAATLFASVANNKDSSVSNAEEAVYYEADCQRLLGNYARAAEVYNLQLGSYPMGKHAQQARQRLFDIANYWLDDTRAYMEACREKREGKRWWVWPMSLVSIEKTKPLFDTEGHAVRMLEQVYITDPQGPLAEKALFYLGSVKFFREDYKEADHYFHQLVTHCPNGKLAPEALRYSVICKQMCTGGSEYDGRVLGEALDMLNIAQASYPELARDKNEFIMHQRYSISQQQADSDWKVAQFYERIGKPASAYFYYELVRRRYHGSEYARKAEERMAHLKESVDREKAKDQQLQEQARQQEAKGGGPETGPVPRIYTPGSPLPPLDNGPAPPALLPSLGNDRRGP
jgi:TolA-binding protein